MKGSALRHSVERLGLDTVLVTFGEEYLLLSDDDTQRGALKAVELVGSTAQLREDNRKCIWLEGVWSER